MLSNITQLKNILLLINVILINYTNQFESIWINI